MVREGQSGDGSSRLDCLLSGTLPLESHEQTRTNLAPLLCPRRRFFLAVLDESKSETRPHRDALEQQFQWTSWEESDFAIRGVHYRQDVVHNLCPSTARDDQSLTPWEI